MSSGFKKIAFRLIGLISLFAIIVAVYLYFNFKSKSNLTLMVPSDADWVYHIQTKSLRQKLPSNPPKYLDSLQDAVAQLPIFKSVSSPQDIGIDRFSDLVIFKNNYGWHVIFRVFNESKFQAFLQKLVANKYLNSAMVKANYTAYLSAKNTMFVVQKQGIGCLYIPADTLADVYAMHKDMEHVFKPGRAAINKNEGFQKLMKHCDIYYFNRLKEDNSFGYVYNSTTVERRGLDGKMLQTSPLKFYKTVMPSLGAKHVNTFLNTKNKFTSRGLLSLHFAIAHQFIKPFNSK